MALELFALFCLIVLIGYIYKNRHFIMSFINEANGLIDEPFIDDRDYTYNNKTILDRVHPENLCSCIYCKTTLQRKDIVIFTKDDTAICPICGVDSIVPYELQKDDLEQLHRLYFSDQKS